MNGAVRVDGRCVILTDSGIGVDAGPREDADAAECDGAVEVCDGDDNDCDSDVDETFDCIAGARVPCSTSCGTIGDGLCTASCGVPTTAECVPPAEICNYEDDDCDSAIDPGMWATGETVTLSSFSNVSHVRAVPAPDGYWLFVLLDGNDVVAQRLGRDGAVVGTPHVVQTDVVEFDVAALDDRIIVTWLGAGEVSVSARDRDSMAVVVEPQTVLIGAASVASLRVAADRDQVLLLFVDGSEIVGVATDADLTGPFTGEAIVTLVTTAWPRRFEVLAPAGSVDWYLAYVDVPSGASGEDIYLQRIRPWGSASGGRFNVTFTPADRDVSPALAFDPAGVLALAYSTDGTLFLRVMNPSDFDDATTHRLGGSVPIQFVDAHPATAMARSLDGHWVLAFHDGPRDSSAVRGMVVDDLGAIAVGADDAPWTLAPAGANFGVTVGTSGSALAAVGSSGETRTAVFGCSP